MTENGRHKTELTPKQAQAVRVLLTCSTLREAAKQVGIAEGTLYDWMADPTFRAELRAAEAAALEDVIRGLTGASQAALGTILTIMRNTRAPVSVRLRAAVTILEQLIKLRELHELELRVAQLEARLANEQRYETKVWR